MPSTNGHGPQPERVALYLRVSSEEQRDAGTIQTQRESLERHAAKRGFEVVEVYADEGVSGKFHLHERPEGLRLLEDARADRFDTVLVYKLDRLARSQLGILDAADRLERLGIALRSATEHYETATAQGRLLFQMLGSFAEFERSTIRERTQDGLHRKYREGRYMGTVPFGYTLTKRGCLEAAPKEAELVREIFERIASGGTLYAVAAWLSKLGVPPPSWKYSNGKRRSAEKWLPETVRLIVKNTRYTGTHKITLSTGEVVEQSVPAIVEPELRRRALAQLEENRRYSGGKKGRNYLLRSLVTCEVCGCTCVGHTHTARGKKYPYYKCSDDHPLRTRRAPLNHAPYVPAGWLEETVWADVRQFLENPGEVLERVREEMMSDHAGAELEARRMDLEKRLATKSTEKDRYVHAFARGHISEEELSEYVTDLKNQIDNLRLLIRGVEDELAAKHEHSLVAENVEAWLLNLRERVEEVEEDSEEGFSKRLKLVKLLVEGISVGRDEDGKLRTHITYRFGPPDGSDEAPEGMFVGGVKSATAA